MGGATRRVAHPEAFRDYDEPCAYAASASITISRSATGNPGPALVNSFLTSVNCFEMPSKVREKSMGDARRGSGREMSRCFFGGGR